MTNLINKNIKVTKKDGTTECFDTEKIISAITKSADRIGRTLSKADFKEIIESLKQNLTQSIVHVSDLHKMVVNALKDKFPDVAKSYQDYRDYKLTYAKDFDTLFQETKDVLYLGDRENANFDSALISTKGSLIRGYLTKKLYQRFYLTKKEAELTRRGDIYLHDLRDMLMHSYNCNLFDLGEVLRGGFELANVRYTEPTSVLSALQVTGDITLSASANQFGGFTLAELDRVMVPYCKKTLDKAYEEYDTWFGGNDSEKDSEKREEFAWHKLTRELEQGMQSLELKLNTLNSARGDFSFVTVTFGAMSKDATEEDKKIQRKVCSVILKTRKEGHGPDHIAVVFPWLLGAVCGNIYRKRLWTRKYAGCHFKNG